MRRGMIPALIVYLLFNHLSVQTVIAVEAMFVTEWSTSPSGEIEIMVNGKPVMIPAPPLDAGGSKAVMDPSGCWTLTLKDGRKILFYMSTVKTMLFKSAPTPDQKTPAPYSDAKSAGWGEKRR